MKKQYMGEVPFDHFGNQKSAAFGYRMLLQEKNLVNGCLYLSIWDGRKHVDTLSIFTPAEARVEYLTSPDPRDPKAIATMPSHILVPNYIFVDSLEYVGFTRGGSSVNLSFKSLSTGRTFIVFLSDLAEFVERMDKGKILNTQFTFCKRGTRFGLKILP